jgi:hypothetical protein
MFPLLPSPFPLTILLQFFCPLVTPPFLSNGNLPSMKTSLRIANALVTGAILFLLNFLPSPSYALTNYFVHEWGTFTSVQGSDGQLLPWHPLESSELPKFVFSTANSGSNISPLVLSKVNMITLQRMETPVIYFYAAQPMNVDVSVTFPKGIITEWYPQATQIGPFVSANTNFPAATILGESRAIWRDLQLIPQSDDQSALTSSLPQDSSGSHYFAARETKASFVRANFPNPTNPTSETEKFIFYRGAGSFKTPLRVTINSNSIVTVENTGAEPLAHLFLLSIHDGQGAFGVLNELAASNSLSWLPLNANSGEHWNQFPLALFQAEITAQVQSALISQGLFPNEAQAMVNTWKDSWFTEEGVRILYLLPRPWTDEILPLKLTPQPSGLTRVMVGRAEIIPPNATENLVQLLTQAQTGDENARAQASNELKKLGRFAEPALQLASLHSSQTNIMNTGLQLLHPSWSTVTFE